MGKFTDSRASSISIDVQLPKMHTLYYCVLPGTLLAGQIICTISILLVFLFLCSLCTQFLDISHAHAIYRYAILDSKKLEVEVGTKFAHKHKNQMQCEVEPLKSGES